MHGAQRRVRGMPPVLLMEVLVGRGQKTQQEGWMDYYYAPTHVDVRGS
jgi:hypothetical protein